MGIGFSVSAHQRSLETSLKKLIAKKILEHPKKVSKYLQIKL